MLNTCGAPFLSAQVNRQPFSLGYPAMELPRNYHKLLGAAFHLRIPLGATQSSNLALGAGLEPAADFRQMINSHPPATNSGTLE